MCSSHGLRRLARVYKSNVNQTWLTSSRADGTNQFLTWSWSNQRLWEGSKCHQVCPQRQWWSVLSRWKWRHERRGRPREEKHLAREEALLVILVDEVAACFLHAYIWLPRGEDQVRTTQAGCQSSPTDGPQIGIPLARRLQPSQESYFSATRCSH